MWFKNLKVFRLARHWQEHWGEIEHALSAHQFTPVGDLSTSSQGWVPPREGDDRLAVNVGGQLLLALRIEKKLLPASVVNQAVKDRAKEIEEQQGYRPGRKQMRDIKEMVIDSLMPSAFKVAKDVRVWIDPINCWVVLDTASSPQVEDVLAAFGKAMHPYPVEHLRLTHSRAQQMTSWLIAGEAPEGLSIDADSHWQSGGNSAGVIKYAKCAAPPDDIQKRVESGYQCTRLALTWQDRISFVLTDTADFKRVQALDILEEQAKADGDLSEHEKLDADFTLMTAELNQMLGDVLEALKEQQQNPPF